jgi:hypothetical protein
VTISYKPKPFRVLVGDAEFDATDYIDGFEIGTPDPEIGQKLTWTGSFELFQNQKAGRTLPPDTFSLYAHPERWRPDRRIQIELTASTGETARIPLRIQRYGITNKAGKASVWQLADALDRDRPGMDAEFAVGGNGTPIKEAIERLLTLAFTDTGMNPTVVNAAIAWGSLNDMVSTRNPIPDVTQLASTCWQWLTHGANESFQLISGDPLNHPVLFARPEGEFEIEPNTEQRNNWLSRSIVTGSYQQPVPPKSECPTDPPVGESTLDYKQRPKVIKTTIHASHAEVFQGSSSRAKTVQEEKYIFYEYGDSQTNDKHGQIIGATFALQPSAQLFEIDAYIDYLPPDFDNEEVVRTVTVSLRPAGSIFPSLGASQSQLRFAQVEIQAERTKATLKPWGTIYQGAGANFSLERSPEEEIDETYASRPNRQPYRSTNPQGQSENHCLEKKVKPEPRQAAPQWEMQTVPVRAECAISPTGWTPLIKLPLITDFGFLPSQAHGDYLACQIAAKEIRKLDQWSVVMPIPDEWIKAGMPGYFRAHLHDAQYEAVAVRLIYARNPNSAKLAFHAMRIGAAPIVPRNAPAIPPISFDGTLQIRLNVTTIDGISGLPLGPFFVAVSGGNP